VFSVSVTGIATPSLDARLVNRMKLRTDVKRTPIFGLGCVGGAAGIARATDYLRAYPDEIAVLLSVELCSLTLQRGDTSIANVIASGLFGDGAAAVVLCGGDVAAAGPRVVATRSVFYPAPSRSWAGRWATAASGSFSADVPAMAAGLRPDVERFLGDARLRLGDVDLFICHPGGPKVLEAIESALSLPPDALRRSWEHLERVGNLSSASVLFVLGDAIAENRWHL
jgi:alkylresorcinol/alkylpyrone synthase